MKLFLIAFISLMANANMNKITPYNLTIQVFDIPSSQGNLMIALYNKEDGFREKDKTYRNLIIPAKKGTMEVVIDQLPVGNYAAAIYHDANGNGKLDKNILGIPTEYYGFSNDAKGSFGPPSFESCKFNFSASKTISIHLK